MKNISLAEFVLMPSGTMFQFCKGDDPEAPEDVSEGLHHKRDSVDFGDGSEIRDFWYMPIFAAVSCGMCSDHAKLQFLDSQVRWGMYDNDQRFVVFEPAEVEVIIELIRKGFTDSEEDCPK